MHSLGTIREFKTKNFTVVVDAIEEFDVDLSWDEDGEVQKALNSGKYLVFCARARVLFRGNEVASDYLGNCIYESLEDFADHRKAGRANREQGMNCGSYFKDMIHTVCDEARKAILDSQNVKVRVA